MICKSTCITVEFRNNATDFNRTLYIAAVTLEYTHHKTGEIPAKIGKIRIRRKTIKKNNI